MEGSPIWSLGDLILDPDRNRNTSYHSGDGVHWFLEEENGFWGAPGNSGERVQRFNQHGAIIGPGWKEERIIKLKGYAFAPTHEQLRRASAAITGLLGDPYDGLPLTCYSEMGEMTCQVWLDGEIITQPYKSSTPAITWDMQLVAPDPRRYSTAWTTMTTSLPLDNDSDGLDFVTNSGLDFVKTNMAENPVFSNLSWWQPLSVTDLSLTTAQGVPNNTIPNSAGLMTANAAGNNGVQSPKVPSPAAQTAMTFSTYIYSSSPKTITVYAAWYDSNGTWLSENSVNISVPANQWVRPAVTTPTRPGTANSWQVTVRETGAAAGSNFKATGMLVEQGTSASSSYSFQGAGSVGLVFGTTTGSTGQLYAKNQGTAPTTPIYRLYGPLTSPVLTGTANGVTRTMKYNANILAGEYVEIDPAALSVQLVNAGGSASRRYLLNPSQFTGFDIPPASFNGVPGSLTVGLTHAGPATDPGFVEVTYRNAWF